MKVAEFYDKTEDHFVECNLCPHLCKIASNKKGRCRVRINKDGVLYSETYGRLTSVSMDPVEKKPLYHFSPSSPILSLGSFGCTMRCKFCQNEQISQCDDYTIHHSGEYTLDLLEKIYKSKNVKLVAFTYNEPVVFYEFMIDIVERLKREGASFAMITNGFINKEPLKALTERIDAFNVDLKAFQEAFYNKMTASTLKPVLEALDLIKKSGRHLEITYLVVPGLNDQVSNFKEMINYVKENLGKDQVLHISRYFPHYKVNLPPTPIDKIKEFIDIAKENLDYVYAGNTGNAFATSTLCPKCGSTLIERNFYQTVITGLDKNKCDNCGNNITGVF